MPKKQKKIIKSGIVHVMHEGVRHTFQPGDVVPDWAEITNPAVIGYADDSPQGDGGSAGDNGAGDAGGTPTGSPADASKVESKEPTIKELKATAKELGIAQGGSKADLAARIAAKQAESADAGGNDAAAADGVDGDSSDRAALEARAKERGIEFDENTTDDELLAELED